MSRTSGFVWLLAVFSCAPAVAATIPVNTSADDLASAGHCSLRSAIAAANTNAAVGGCVAGSGADTILLPAGTYTLTLAGANEDGNVTGDLDVTESLTITGSGAATTILDGNGADRVLDLLSGVDAVTLTHLTIRNGQPPTIDTTVVGGGVRSVAAMLGVDDVTFADNSALAGGGIDATQVTASHCRFVGNRAIDTSGGIEAAGGALTSGHGTVSDCQFEGNLVSGVAAAGGAIESRGDMTISGCTFGDNSAQYGGAIDFYGDLVVSGSTFRGNSGSQGGAIYADNSFVDGKIVSCTFVGNGGGAIEIDHTNANLYIYGSTIAYNDGPGIAVGATTIQLRNSIVLGNRSVDGTGDEDCALVGSLQSLGYNVLATGTGCDAVSSGLGDQHVAVSGEAGTLSPTLASLGGPTDVLPLPASSIAIGKGTCSDADGTAEATDQRGVPRVAPCDVGAVQTTPAAGTLVKVTPEPAGAHCASGGQRVDAGVDSDDDGVLEAAEIATTTYICASGSSGAATLVTVTPLPSGDGHCASGGSRVDAGPDRDGDGVLEAGEIGATSYVCSAKSGGSGGCQLTPASSSGAPGLFMLAVVGVALRGRRRRAPQRW